MTNTYDVVIAGAGIYGATAALALAERGHRVALLDPGPIPHPLASSTDISKVVRIEYGSDELFMTLVEESLPLWRAWNDAFGQTLYHETGVTMVDSVPMSPGEFLLESYQRLVERGHDVTRLDAAELHRRFPAWHPETYVDGFFHAAGGYAESGAVVSAVVRQAAQRGVTVQAASQVESLVIESDRVTGVKTANGNTLYGDHVVIAAGAWTVKLVPELAEAITVTGQPVFHLQAPTPALFTPPDFSVFAADVTSTGWYGFPQHPRERVVKIANHGVGVVLDPVEDERVVTADDEAALRKMLERTFPTLVDAPVVYTRRCLYSDTFDGNLWIDRHPEIDGLTVATGGSGHAFKFAPRLGEIIADCVEGQSNDYLPRFVWRDPSQATEGGDSLRYKPD